MSLAIDVDRVEGVLLADGWHKVQNHSFMLDAYEFVVREGPDERPERCGGGDEKFVVSTGARWVEPSGVEVFCPLTAVLAARYARPQKKKTMSPKVVRALRKQLGFTEK